jgi:YbbR domain-containing protein
MGLLTRLRQNLSLKIVSLVAAVLLYVYVQQERNPTISRSINVPVEYKNRQEGYKVVPEAPHVTVIVTGPRPSVDRLKDGDIRASADVANLTSNQPSAPVKIVYEMPRGSTDVMLDTAPDIIKVQVFREKSRKMRVEPVFHQDSPAGVKYGDPVIRPQLVTVRGREDYVNRVDKIVAEASPNEPQASIDGDFSVAAWDSDHNVVEGVTIDPERVHVTIPQVLLPSEHTVLVEAALSDRPVEPFYIVEKIFTPNQVKIIGTPDRVSAISAIYTETLSVRDLTTTTTMDASLIIPPDITVRDLRGKQVTRVKVTFVIAKHKTEPQPAPDGAVPSSPPRHEGAVGQ